MDLSAEDLVYSSPGSAMMHACMVAHRAATENSASFISAPDPKAGMAAMLPVNNGGSCCRLHRTRGAAMKSPPTHPPSVTSRPHPLLPYPLSRSGRHLTPECAPDCLTLRLRNLLCVRYEWRTTLLESERAALNVCGLAKWLPCQAPRCAAAKHQTL